MNPESTPANDTDPQHLAILQKFRIIIRAAQKYSQRVEKQLGVTGAQLWVMKEIYQSPGLRVGEIAKKMAIHQTTTSNLLDALEKKNMVKKTRTANDQRIVLISLTEQGQKLIEQTTGPVRGLLPEALAKMDASDLDQLGQSLDVLMKCIAQIDVEESALLPLPFTM